MRTYLEATRHASEGLIDLFTRDLRLLKEEMLILASSLAKLEVWTREQEGKDNAEDVMREEFWEDFENRVRKHSRQARASFEKARELRSSIADKQFSLSVLCGALLQIAKQAI